MSNNNNSNEFKDDPRKTIPNNFGDVMSSRTTTLSLPDEFSGLERICLTANGNLQRILSSWFNKTVKVDIIKNNSVDITENKIILDGNIDYNYNTTKDNNCELLPVLKRFDREVNLVCEGKIVCNAKSDILISDYNIVKLIEYDFGIGQLFRYLDKLPSFQLYYIGKTTKTWWREYSLHISGVECFIKETFPNDLFNNGWLNNNDNSLMNRNDSGDNFIKKWKLALE